MLKATLLVTALVLGATGAVRADPLLDACQTVLLDRLLSPSSYKEIEVKRAVVEMSPGEWYAQEVSRVPYESADDVKREHTERTQREFERMMRDGIRPALTSLIIEFDASNAYGAIIRGRARCSHYETGTGIEPNPQTVGLYLLDR